MQIKTLSPLVVPGQPWYCYNFEKGVHKEHTAGERLESCYRIDPKNTYYRKYFKDESVRSALLRAHLREGLTTVHHQRHEPYIQWTVSLYTCVEHITITYLTRLEPEVMSHGCFPAHVSCRLFLLGGTSEGCAILWAKSLLGL